MFREGEPVGVKHLEDQLRSDGGWDCIGSEDEGTPGGGEVQDSRARRRRTEPGDVAEAGSGSQHGVWRLWSCDRD